MWLIVNPSTSCPVPQYATAPGCDRRTIEGGAYESSDESKYHAIVRLMEQTSWRDDQPSVPRANSMRIVARSVPGKPDDLDIAAQQERPPRRG